MWRNAAQATGTGPGPGSGAVCIDQQRRYDVGRGVPLSQFCGHDGERPVPAGGQFVRVGEDPASKVYVGRKEKACAELGIVSETHVLAEKTSEAELLALIRRLNADASVHGIIVQLPLPKGIDAAILVVPAPVVKETLEACARQDIGGAVVFASGFSEQDEAGKKAQDEFAAVAAPWAQARSAAIQRSRAGLLSKLVMSA